MKSDWISVEDELPEDEELVFCYGISLEDGDNYENIFGDGQFYESRGGVDFYGPTGHVTHWMKPKAPEVK